MRARPARRRLTLAAITAGVTALAVVAPTIQANGAPAAPAFLRSCGLPAAGYAACDALLSTRIHADAATASGYGPAGLQSAYNLASAAATAGGTQTVALVDAYNDPTAAADLNVYRANYGLPACTTASGCFAQVAGNGGTSLPANNYGWAQEESLDVDMVSAICPNCRIRLVEAASASLADLATAERTAIARGATEVSNSYGGRETPGEVSTAQSSYTAPGVYITASAGDSGYGTEFPAVAPSVIAVGGTSLVHSSTPRGWSETVWGSGARSALLGGTGSGCSSYEPKPSWQKDTGCAKRVEADVSADADPNTGVAVYDSSAYKKQSGWLEFGGTSVSSPIIASVAALAGNAATYPKIAPGAYLYARTAYLNDVTSGSNGVCTPSYLCTAGTGYDGPTGNGTPNGIGAF